VSAPELEAIAEELQALIDGLDWGRGGDCTDYIAGEALGLSLALQLVRECQKEPKSEAER
jgi:hypothetical protein